MKFIDDKFLLHSRAAQRLYRQFAEDQPIFDFHCHLPPKDVAENRQFRNLYEIWLEDDHYKWRAMRANGVAEQFCTGSASPYDKFAAWAATVPHTVRNPLFHWTHLELKRYFGIDELLDEESAARIWKKANEQLARPEFSARGILKKFNVASVCTTDDPTDDLVYHEKIVAGGVATGVYPAFRPDNALAVGQPVMFNAWISQLEKAADTDIIDLDDFLAALRRRHDYFHAHGCRLSDHGLSQCPASMSPEKTVAAIFARVRRGQAATVEEQIQFSTAMMLHFGRWDAEKGWVKQLHLGALRNNNSRFMERIGSNAGFDCIGDFPQARSLAVYLDLLERENSLPKIIVYNSNPADNYVFASLIGSFQDGKTPGKIQLGAGWWFLDQKEGIEWQINALSNNGLLSRFIGMVTDSRSFMSYPRHEYFRRVLCNLIGQEVERGDLPNDEALLGTMIRNICFNNAQQYLALPKKRGIRSSGGRRAARAAG